MGDSRRIGEALEIIKGRLGTVLAADRWTGISGVLRSFFSLQGLTIGAVLGSLLAALIFLPIGNSLGAGPTETISTNSGPVDRPWEGVVPESTQYRGDRLTQGQSLSLGDYIASPNLLSMLHMTNDGNVIVAVNGTIAWETDTGGIGATGLKMQRDGNLVVLSQDRVLWSPTDLPPGQGQAAPDDHRAAAGAGELVIQDDGNLVAYNDSDNLQARSWWQSGTSLGADEPSLADRQSRADPAELGAGDELRRGEYIHNLNRQEDVANAPHALRLDNDGNLVIHGAGGNEVWRSHTGGLDIHRLLVQDDGDVVLLSADGAVKLHTGTGGNPGAYLRLNDEGNLVVHRVVDGERLAIWTRGPDGSRLLPVEGD